MVRWTDRPAMTIAVDLGHKATNQIQKTKKKERYISFCKNTMSGGDGIKKLQIYRLVKDNFTFEPCLDDLHDITMRKCVCSFPISAPLV